jgi:ribosomal protein S18 acetylase RimI-like enzyme
MEIRRMRAEDLEAVARIYLEAYAAKWTEAGAREYLGRFFGFEPQSCLVAVGADGRIAGAVLGYSYKKESGLVLFIQELFVNPAQRKLGVGRKLVSALRESFTEHATVNVTPLVKADTGVLNFYNSLGFEREKAFTFFDE